MNTALETRLTVNASTIPEASRGGSEEADQNPAPIAIWITMAMSHGSEEPKNCPSTPRREGPSSAMVGADRWSWTKPKSSRLS